MAAISRAFWKTEYKKMVRNYHRMMMGYEKVVRMKAIYSSKGDHLGWRLKITDIPISNHDRHFLQERGLPVPGKFKCTMSICQEKRNGLVRVR